VGHCGQAGLSRDGQTRSILQLAVAAGVRRVIVAVNKSESTPVSRWNEITAEIATYTTTIPLMCSLSLSLVPDLLLEPGWHSLAQRLQFDGDLLVLAISAVDGDNVTTRSFRFRTSPPPYLSNTQ
jgi:translation elongation factor EF-1alpha